jgi:hypothetical protein
MTASVSLQIQIWPIDRLVFYARNPRKNDAAVEGESWRISEHDRNQAFAGPWYDCRK